MFTPIPLPNVTLKYTCCIKMHCPIVIPKIISIYILNAGHFETDGSILQGSCGGICLIFGRSSSVIILLEISNMLADDNGFKSLAKIKHQGYCETIVHKIVFKKKLSSKYKDFLLLVIHLCWTLCILEVKARLSH